MLFLDLSSGNLATYSLRLHSPSKYAVSQRLDCCCSTFACQILDAVACQLQHAKAELQALSCWMTHLRRPIFSLLPSVAAPSFTFLLLQPLVLHFCCRSLYLIIVVFTENQLAVQVSQSGRFVATFFKHTVFVYSTQRPAMQPLKLYHTRLLTVST